MPDASEKIDWKTIVENDDLSIRCESLADSIRRYSTAARRASADNPEAMSLTLLTVMEMWVACDKIATTLFPLLADYSTGFCPGLFDPLILSRKEELIRLAYIEEYLLDRESRASEPPPWELHHGGSWSERSFPVRYYEASPDHQSLHLEIIKLAEAKKAETLANLTTQKYQYRQYMRQYESSSHIEKLCENSKSKRAANEKLCPKCEAVRLAGEMEIAIFQWPLPADTAGEKATVFELRVPDVIRTWRELTIGLVDKYFVIPRLKRDEALADPASHPLLRDLVSEAANKCRFQFRSLSSIRDGKKISVNGATVDNVCVDGIESDIYDTRTGFDVKSRLVALRLLEEFAYPPWTIPSPLRNWIMKTSHTLNEVIASQVDCPEGMTLEEFKAYGNMRGGLRLQWQNILCQLTIPSLNFNKSETLYIILQASNEAGPRSRYSPLRETHDILEDKAFATALLTALEAAFERIKGNWENNISFYTFLSLGTRLLSACPIKSVREGCLRYLSEIRHKSIEWAELLVSKLDKSISAKEREELDRRVLSMSLICHGTLDVGTENLHHLLSDVNEAALLIKASMLVAEHLPPRVNNKERILMIFLQRWYNLSYETQILLKNEIVQKASPCLDKAVGSIWEPYSPGTPWSTAAKPLEHILVTHSASTDELQSRNLQYNLLTGNLLVDGSPVSTLPRHLQAHKTYQKLFGNQIIRVLPSLMKNGGMRYTAARNHFGNSVHFGMVNDELIVRTQKNQKTYELIPASYFDADFPALLVSEYLHWLVIGEHKVEFRPQDKAWQTFDDPGAWDGLILEYTPGTAASLAKGDTGRFINFHSMTAQLLSQIVQPLEHHSFLHLIYHEVQSHILIELPRFQVSFTLESGKAVIQSNHYRGFNVDEDQSIGTLFGLENKLVLRLDSFLGGISQRIVIIPHGTVSVSYSETSHVRLVIDPGRGRHGRHHLFQINNTVGLLREQRSLKAKLFLSYLHALTTHCLPDKLTGRTGTEEALRILELQGVRSFDRLDQEEVELLHQIAKISPRRTFTEERIQVVHRPQLPTLAQHDAFYPLAISMLEQAQQYEIFFPHNPQKIKFPHDSNSMLIKRQLMRVAAYHTSQFGAEQFNTSKDSEYESRDSVDNSRKEYETYRLAKFFENIQQDCVLELVLPPTSDDDYGFFAKFADLSHEKFAFDLTAEFDMGWLQRPEQIAVNGWCKVLKEVARCNLKREKYRIMMFLAGFIFAEGADLRIVQLLLAYATSPALRSTHRPRFDQFSLWTGLLPNRKRLHELVDAAKVNKSKGNGSYSERYSGRHSGVFYERSEAVNEFVTEIYDQWPRKSVHMPSSQDYSEHLAVRGLMDTIRLHWGLWQKNKQILDYFRAVMQTLSSFDVVKEDRNTYSTGKEQWRESKNVAARFISLHDIFQQTPPTTVPRQTKAFSELVTRSAQHVQTQPGMPVLLDNLRRLRHFDHEQNYIQEMEQSLEKVEEDAQDTPSIELYSLREPTDKLLEIFEGYRRICEQAVADNFSRITDSLSRTASASAQDTTVSTLWPRITPIMLLTQLARKQWSKCSEEWRRCLIDYAISVTALQRAERMLKSVQSPKELIKELQTIGHENWDPMEFPESLLFEVENGILIRPVQERIARAMRDPPEEENAVMQLNMGEGKSTVIVPIVAAALADGTHLVRIIATKAQSRQMMHSLTAALGGLLGHRIYTLPFSRDFRSGRNEADLIKPLYDECRTQGGVLLVQPEHLLSFKLLGLESMISKKECLGRTLLKTQYLFDKYSRDIVDESDENFNVRFELTYTMGTQKPIDLSPQRWLMVQSAFSIIAKLAQGIGIKFLGSMEIETVHEEGFPRIRVHDEWAGKLLMEEVGRYICQQGIEGFPHITRRTPDIQAAAFRYITQPNLTLAEVSAVEAWFSADSMFKPLLLLRGLIAGGILVFCLHQKRWRVNYGRVYNRHPPTGLAVPYRAKDCPAPRSEFSHPDVVIILTCLSYYYSGLSNDELSMAFEQLSICDQGESIYSTWANAAPQLPAAFQHLSGVNIKDREQCAEDIFPYLRFVKPVLDFYLSEILFPKEMREFPEKLSGSGWDIAMTKQNPTTGFSGTNDSKSLLPLSIKHLDFEEQKHTNASMLNCLLRPENCVLEICLNDRHSGGKQQLASEFLLRTVAESRPRIQVILDVGAQILEFDNLEATKSWLAMLPSTEADAGIFFDEHEELCVVTRAGIVEQFNTSPYSTNTASCVVFLDEAHTRGTDLRLPDHYRAAVTLGPKLNKDKLMQACMRMRKLGKGQSIVFFANEEICRKIREIRLKASGGSAIPVDGPVSTTDVLTWSIWETWQECYKCIPIWATQGIRFQQQDLVWDEARAEEGFNMTPELASKYLENEARTIEERYRPLKEHAQLQNSLNPAASPNSDQLLALKSHELELIRVRCEQFGVSSFSSTGVNEEQERELSTEREQERQIMKPARMSPHTPKLHDDVIHFIATGDIPIDSQAFRPAFQALADSSVAKLVDLTVLPSEILVTVDFTQTVKLNGRLDVSDSYQRTVQWLVTSFQGNERNAIENIKHLVVLSPFEVNHLLPDIRRSRVVSLHMYAPRTSLAYSSMEELTLYTAPTLPSAWQLPWRMVLQLILFAGQLYLRSYPDYVQLCRFLGLSIETNFTKDENVLPDGFITTSAGRGDCVFNASPLPFLKVLVEQIRRGCEDISKTDVGRIFAGERLKAEDFAGNSRWRGYIAPPGHE